MLQDRNSKNFSFPAQIGLLIGLTGVGMVIASFLSAYYWVATTHTTILTMQTELANPDYYWTTLVLQGISSLFMMFFPVMVFAAICYHKKWKFLGAVTPVSAKQFLWVVGILIMVFPLGGALAELNQIIPLPARWATKFKEMENNRKEMEAALININTLPKYLISMFIIAILPALFEEFYFRGGLQNVLTRRLENPATAIILTAIIFSAIHISYYGFLVRFALGIILGYIFYYSGSIWLSAFLHFLFNGVQVTAMYISKLSNQPNVKDVEETFPLWAGIPALIILLFLLREFRKESIRVQQRFVYKEPDDPNDIHDWIANN